MQPQTAKKIDQLRDRRSAIEGALRRGLPLNEIAWTGLRNELLKLYELPSERRAAAPFLAAVYCFSADVDEVVRFTNISLRLGALTEHSYNYLQFASIRVGEFGLADIVEAHALENAVELDFNNNLSAQMQMGRFRKAAELAEANVEKLSFIHRQNFDDLRLCASYLTARDIVDEQITERLQVAVRCFLTAAGRPVFNAVINPTPVGILYGIPFDGSDIVSEDIDIAIAAKVDDGFEDSLAEHFSIITYPSEAVLLAEDVELADRTVEA